MKNIHVLPTDKPSRLRYNLSNVLVLTKEPYRDYSKQVNQNIYITSDEEIKEGDWFYLYDADIIAKYVNVKPVKEGKKIILTTDLDLIADGVQAIDDEFLEWFVKNPKCEEVETVFACRGFNGIIPNLISIGEYKIAIPTEEPKFGDSFENLANVMSVANSMFGVTEEPKQENCCTPIGRIKRYVDCKGCDRKPKQESIESQPKVGDVSGTFSFGDKVIWDSHFGYDIATFIGEGAAYEHWKIELHSGKFRHTETMVSKSELHHYSKELIAEMTKRYGYEKDWSDVF